MPQIFTFTDMSSQQHPIFSGEGQPHDAAESHEPTNFRPNESGREVVGFEMEIQLGFSPLAVNTAANMNSITNLTPRQLRQAADIQERIQGLQKELGQILGTIAATTPVEAPKRRTMSAAGRRAIAAAAKARWAKIKGRGGKRNLSAQGLANIRAGVAKRMAAQRKAVKKVKRKFSAAGLAALSAAAKARWAKAKSAGKSRL
jgi:hypothetical protein